MEEETKNQIQKLGNIADLYNLINGSTEAIDRLNKIVEQRLKLDSDTKCKKKTLLNRIKDIFLIKNDPFLNSAEEFVIENALKEYAEGEQLVYKRANELEEKYFCGVNPELEEKHEKFLQTRYKINAFLRQSRERRGKVSEYHPFYSAG